MLEFKGDNQVNRPHTFEVEKIELIDESINSGARQTSVYVSRIDGAKLLKNVEKSYDNGVKLIDNKQNKVDGSFELKRVDGTVYGWAEGNRIHLTPEGINPEAPVHEYTHMWAKAVMHKNPQLWSRVKNMMKGTPIWDEVVNDPAYKNLITDDAIASEALSRISGKNNAEKLEKMAKEMLAEANGNGVFAEANARALIARLRQALKDFWKWVGVNLFDMQDVKNIDEVTDRVLYDLVSGTDLQLNDYSDSAVEFSKVTDTKLLEELENGETFRMFNTMVKIDGEYYAPMNAYTSGKAAGTKTKQLNESSAIEQWMQSDETEINLTEDQKNRIAEIDASDEGGDLEIIPGKLRYHKGKKTNSKKKSDEEEDDSVGRFQFLLVKESGSMWVAYNPYAHLSDTPMNDQFTGAYSRSINGAELVTVEWDVPVSEKTSGYHAEHAKDHVGIIPWHSGSVNGSLPENRKRHVMLTRYRKAVREVPATEVAKKIADKLKGTDLVIPFNLMPVDVLEELAKIGVPISTANVGSIGAADKADFMRRKADWEKKYPNAKFSDLKMTKEEYSKWGKGNKKLSAVENSGISEAVDPATKTKPFKAWFGDWEKDPEHASKVVNEDGTPMKIKHATTEGNKGFTVFNTQSDEKANNNVGSHFGNSAAEDIVENNKLGGSSENDVYDVYLNIRNPYETYDWFAQDDSYPLIEAMKLADEIGTPEAKAIIDEICTPEIEGGKNEWIRPVYEEFKERGADAANDFIEAEWFEGDTNALYTGIRKLLKMAGYDGIKYFNDLEGFGDCWVALEPNQIKSAESGEMANNGDYSDADDIRFREDDKTLYGSHNISEENLRKVIKNGGLANPSVAVADITKNVHDGFGEITLILPPMMIDKRTGDNSGTWTDDTWTPTYPKTRTMFTDAGWNAFRKMLDNIDMDEELRASIINDAQQMQFGSTPNLSWLFLKSKGIDATEYKHPDLTSDWNEIFRSYKSVQSLLKDLRDSSSANYEVINSKLNRAVISYFNVKFQNEHPELVQHPDENDTKSKIAAFRENKKKTREIYGIEDGNLSDEQIAEAYNAMIKRFKSKKNGVDAYWSNVNAYETVIKRGLESEYNKWLDKTLSDLGVVEELRDGSDRNGNAKWIPNTLRNASYAMNKSKKTGVNTMGGWGTFIAEFSKNMGILSEIRDNKNKLADNPEVRAEVTGMFSELAKMLYDKSSELGLWDGTAAKALARIVKSSNIEKACQKYGITLSSDELDVLKDFAKKMKSGIANYFETKFERPVFLNEFTAAVVPKKTSKDIIDALKSQGLTVYKYDPEVDGDRASVTEKATRKEDALFREKVEFNEGERLDIEKNEYSEYQVPGLNNSYGTTFELLNEFREKYPSYIARLSEDETSITVSSWRDAILASKKRGNVKLGSVSHEKYLERKTRNAIAFIDEQAKKLGLNVRVLTSTEGLKGKRANAKGWYNTTTGEITIVLPNHSNGEDVMRTILHEGVAHHGLREMFGDDFDTFLDNVYRNADQKIRKQIADMAAKHGWDFRVATEEYLAGLAEDTNFESRQHNETWWKHVKFIFDQMLRKVGINLGTSLTDSDLRYILWKSYNNMARNNDHGIVNAARTELMKQQLGVGNYARDNVADDSGPEDDGPGGGIRFREGEDEEEDSTPMSMQDSILDGLMKLAERNSENVQHKVNVIQNLGNRIDKIRRAMAAQRNYDRSTVKEIVGLAKLMMKNGYINNLTSGEVRKLLGVIANGTGGTGTIGNEEINDAGRKVVEILIDNQLRESLNLLNKITNIKASKINAAGVEVQGKLDVEGQLLIKAFRDCMNMTEQDIADRMAEVSDRMSSEDNAVAETASIEYAALNLALEYVQNIKNSRAEEKDLLQQIKDAKQDKDAGNITAEAYKQFVESTNDAIMQNKIERIDSARELAAKLAGVARGSAEKAKQFMEREKERVKNIQHFANSDMEGRPANEHIKENWKQKFMNNPLLRFFLKPLGTFDQMLRMFGNKNVNGEGYLYNHYMRGWINATTTEYKKFLEDCKTLDDKVSEVMGKKMRWSDLYKMERKMPKATVSFWDGGKMQDHELTQGNMLYIYMVNKMADGKMKLRKMGITEEDVEHIKDLLDPRFLQIADWLQDDFLVKKRNDFNEIHQRLFGAPMAAIENYFPLKILSNARVENVDVSEVQNDKTLPSTTTGSIIKRRRNSIALDITGADAFSVVIEHLQSMEKWAAFAEFNRDINTLLSYKRFRNQVQNMSSIYGSGKKLWDNFRDTARIAAGTYKPKVDNDSIDAVFLNIAKGVTAAKIAFRIFTALKQFLSFPAYFSEANIFRLAESMIMPWRAWNFAIKELPTFEKRVKSRQAGDNRLMDTDMDWSFWKNNIVDTLSRWGMTPNAFVDAMTVAIGSYAIYNSKLDKYLKDGYTREQAEKRAKEDAAVLVNETQQSSENAFMSSMQLDRTVMSVSLTVFRNSSMGYQRQLVDAIRTLKRMVTPGYRAESIEYMKKQMIRDGLTEEQAQRAAERTYNRAWVRNSTRIAIFGYIMQLAWDLGPSLAYMLIGDDDDDKKNMLEDAAVQASFGGLEGLSGGNVLSEMLNMKAKGESLKNYDFNLLPLISDVQSIVNHLEGDKMRAVNDITNLVIQSGVGVNPQTVEDIVSAIMDACEDNPKTSEEAAILICRLLSVPKSQIDKIYIDELGMRGDEATKLSVKDMADRYAEFNMKRSGLTSWMYSDQQRKEIEEKYIRRFNSMAKEKISSTGDIEIDEAFDAYQESAKEVAKKLKQVNSLKEIDKNQYREELKKLKATTEFKAYEAFNKKKKKIDEMINAAMKTGDYQDREYKLEEATKMKRELVKKLDNSHEINK